MRYPSLIACAIAALLLLSLTACDPARAATVAEHTAATATAVLDDAQATIAALRAERDRLITLADSVGMDSVAATITRVDAELARWEQRLPTLIDAAHSTQAAATAARERAEAGGGWLGIITAGLSLVLGGSVGTALGRRFGIRALHLARAVVRGIDGYAARAAPGDLAPLHDELRHTMTDDDKALVREMRAGNN